MSDETPSRDAGRERGDSDSNPDRETEADTDSEPAYADPDNPYLRDPETDFAPVDELSRETRLEIENEYHEQFTSDDSSAE